MGEFRHQARAAVSPECVVGKLLAVECRKYSWKTPVKRRGLCGFRRNAASARGRIEESAAGRQADGWFECWARCERDGAS